MGELVTHDLLHALDAARGIAIAQNRPVRIYAVDVPSDDWGRDRKYWIDSRPPEGTPIALALESRPGESHDVRRVDP
jgi:hypothetical protein